MAVLEMPLFIHPILKSVTQNNLCDILTTTLRSSTWKC